VTFRWRRPWRGGGGDTGGDDLPHRNEEARQRGMCVEIFTLVVAEERYIVRASTNRTSSSLPVRAPSSGSCHQTT